MASTLLVTCLLETAQAFPFLSAPTGTQFHERRIGGNPVVLPTTCRNSGNVIDVVYAPDEDCGRKVWICQVENPASWDAVDTKYCTAKIQPDDLEPSFEISAGNSFNFWKNLNAGLYLPRVTSPPTDEGGVGVDQDSKEVCIGLGGNTGTESGYCVEDPHAACNSNIDCPSSTECRKYNCLSDTRNVRFNANPDLRPLMHLKKFANSHCRASTEPDACCTGDGTGTCAGQEIANQAWTTVSWASHLDTGPYDGTLKYFQSGGYCKTGRTSCSNDAGCTGGSAPPCELRAHFDLQGATLGGGTQNQGYYLVTVTVRWEANATGERRVKVTNDFWNTLDILHGTCPAVTTAGQETKCTLSGLTYLASPFLASLGDRHRVEVYQNSGGALDLLPNASGNTDAALMVVPITLDPTLPH